MGLWKLVSSTNGLIQSHGFMYYNKITGFKTQALAKEGSNIMSLYYYII